MDNCSQNCSDTLGGYNCVCYDGYTLESDQHTCNGGPIKVDRYYRPSIFLKTDINECEEGTNLCHNNASCSNTEGSYNCTCIYSYIGDGINCTSKRTVLAPTFDSTNFFTSQGIDLCEVGPTDCHTNATCLDRDGGYDCECDDGYTGNGTYCEGKRNYYYLCFFNSQ